MTANNSLGETPAFRPCPVCRQTTVERLHTMHFVLSSSSPLPDRYEIVACCCCGFVYADTTGSTEDYARHYTDFSLYEDPLTATGSGSSNEDKQRFETMALLFRQWIPRSARILDIGCGNGGLLLTLKNHGFHSLFGMDPSARCVARLNQLDISGIQGTLESIPESVGQFGLIILSHVVEHLLEPVSALASLGKILSTNGKVYIEAPDASRYSAYPFVPFYFFDTEHINHFDRAALTNLAAAAGFDVGSGATKEIPVAGGQAYPAVYVLATSKITPRPGIVEKTENLRSQIESYIANSLTRLEDFTRIENELGPASPLALWGAGSFAQRFLELPWLKQKQILAVVDRDPRKHGLEFAGCTICPPEKGLRNLPSDTTVLIIVALNAEGAVREYLKLGLPYRHRSCSGPSAEKPATAEIEGPETISANDHIQK